MTRGKLKVREMTLKVACCHPMRSRWSFEKLWWDKQKDTGRKKNKTLVVLKSKTWIWLRLALEKFNYCNTIVILHYQTLTVKRSRWIDISLLGVSNPKLSGAVSIVNAIQTAGFIRCVSVTLHPLWRQLHLLTATPSSLLLPLSLN